MNGDQIGLRYVPQSRLVVRSEPVTVLYFFLLTNKALPSSLMLLRSISDEMRFLRSFICFFHSILALFPWELGLA